MAINLALAPSTHSVALARVRRRDQLFESRSIVRAEARVISQSERPIQLISPYRDRDNPPLHLYPLYIPTQHLPAPQDRPSFPSQRPPPSPAEGVRGGRRGRGGARGRDAAALGLVQQGAVSRAAPAAEGEQRAQLWATRRWGRAVRPSSSSSSSSSTSSSTSSSGSGARDGRGRRAEMRGRRVVLVQGGRRVAGEGRQPGRGCGVGWRGGGGGMVVRVVTVVKGTGSKRRQEEARGKGREA